MPANVIDTRRSKIVSEQKSSDDQKYTHHHEHLCDEMAWVRALAIERLQKEENRHSENSKPSFLSVLDANDKTAFAIDPNSQNLTKNSSNGALDSDDSKACINAKSLRNQIEFKLQAAYARDVILPLQKLKSTFQLSSFEASVLLICLAPQIDASFEALYKRLQNDSGKGEVSVDFVLNLLCESQTERLRSLLAFQSNAPLRYFGLIKLLESRKPFSNRQTWLRLTPRLLHYFLDPTTVAQGPARFLRFLPPAQWDDIIISNSFQQKIKTAAQKFVHAAPSQRPVLHFYGLPGTGKKIMARAICKEAGIACVVVDIRSISQSAENFRKRIRLILRESLLLSFAVYFDHVERISDSGKDSHYLRRTLLHEITDMGWFVFFGSESPLPKPPRAANILSLKIPPPDYATRKRIWQKHLRDSFTKGDSIDVEQLASRYKLTAGQISNAIRSTRSSSVGGMPSYADLAVNARKQFDSRLANLATKITAIYTWDDIVLPEDALAQLREMCRRVIHHRKVWNEWGFTRKISAGKGVNALFAGPSGTGKTMAAEIIANALDFDLFKIDLAGVVSKYIGETEKNLDRIFTEAENAGAILFFDEADALFGKRSQVRDAHDRYANIEISYLLQKMEAFEGVTILATNLRDNLDEAFIRRLAFTIFFPFPDEAARRRIWQRLWPEETPMTDDVDFDFLAKQFKLSGGNIKNIVLASAFLAAEDGDKVDHAHVLKAARREYQKMGGSIPPGLEI